MDRALTVHTASGALRARPPFDFAQSIAFLEEFAPATGAAVADRTAFYLSLEDDLRSFYAIAKRDPHFSQIIKRLHGYHQVKFLTPFENACWAILSQHNYRPIARRMKDALVHRYGDSLTTSRRAIARIVERYGPWQGYWAHYLRAATNRSVKR